MEDMEDDVEKFIAITHFINPHQFWYTNVEEDSYAEVCKIEEDITNIYRNNYIGSTRDFEPTIGCNIAVRFLPRNKYIRARVDDIVKSQFSKKVSYYIVWAIDHGFPLETKEEYVRRLPDALAKPIDRVRLGGIAKIVPAEKEFDFIEQRSTMEIKSKWGKRACDTLENMLSDAASIAFTEMFHDKSDQYWGDLQIVNHHGKLFRGSDYLINENVALKNVGKFKEICFGRSTQLPAWQSNDGNSKFRFNTIHTTEAYDCGDAEQQAAPDDTGFQNAKLKVDAWSAHNRRAADYSGQSSNQAITCIESENGQSGLNHNSNDADLKSLNLSERGIHAKNNNKLPPAPTLADFSIDDEADSALIGKCDSLENLSSVSASGSTNPAKNRPYNARLMEMRKKYTPISDSDSMPSVKSSKKVSKANSENNNKHALSSRSGSEAGNKDVSKQSTYLMSEENSKPDKVLANESEEMVVSNKQPTNVSPTSAHGQMLECKKKSTTASSTSTHVKMSDSNKTESSVHDSVSSARMEFLKNLQRKAMNIKETSINENTKEPQQNRMQRKNTIPAGFDLMNLNRYKNPDHWHRRPTTRGKHHPHEKPTSANAKKQNQDFRFTRPNNDKYRSGVEKPKETATEKPISSKKHERSTKTSIPKSDNIPTEKPNPTQKELTEHPILAQKNLTEQRIEIQENLNSTVKENAIEKSITTTSKNPSCDNDDGHVSDSSMNSNDTMYSAVSSLDKENQKDISNQKSPCEIKSNKKAQTTPEFSKQRAAVSEFSDIGKNLVAEQNNGNSMANERALRTKYIEHLVLAHSKVKLYTSENLNKVYLAPKIVTEMHKMYINKVSRIQSYAWQHMVRGNGLFIVNASKSGKTWSFIPALCSAITICLQNSLAPCTYGPLAIVIVPSADHVIETRNNCARLLSELNIDGAGIVASYGLRNITNTKIQLMESCAILVTTPSNLLRLLQDNESKHPLLEPARLQHVVIDDIDVMLERAEEDFTKVFKMIYALAPKIRKSKKIVPQLVVTSRYYIPVFEKLIAISNEPLLLIGDFLEAAVYGKANILLNLCRKEDKFKQILEFIKKHPVHTESLIIMCNEEDDVFAVKQKLTSYGISCIEYHKESTPLTRQLIEEWKLNDRRTEVIICCDAVFPELQIQNAQNLIHYSLAKSWTKFALRFSSLVSLFENLIVNGFNSSKPSQTRRATALILLDEDNNVELPRLVEFLNYHGQGKHVHSEVLALAKSIQLQQENKRCSDIAQLCSSLLQFGECNEVRCIFRHVLTKADIQADQLYEPAVSGDVRLLVLNVFSPTHFSARLLEQRPTGSSKWQIIRQSDKSAHFAMKFKLFCLVPDNLKMHWPVKINDLVICQKNDTFYRAYVVESSQVKCRNVVQSFHIKVKLIDTGEIVYAKTDELFVCPQQFQNFPAQSIDVRLIGVLPFDNERQWDPDSTKHIKTLFMDNVQKNELVHASIEFALIHTIWVNNIVLMEKLPTLENYVYRINLKRYLIDKNYGIANKSAESKIREVIKEHGFEHVLEKPLLTLDNSNDVEEEAREHKNNELKDNEVSSTHSAEYSEALSKTLQSEENHSIEHLNFNKDDSHYQSNISDSDETDIRNKSLKIDMKNKDKYLIEDSQTKVCDFEDLIRCIQRSYEMEAEEYESADENVSKQISAFISETKQMCAAIIESNNCINDNATTQNNDDNNLGHDNDIDIEHNAPAENSTESLNAKKSETQSSPQMPRLQNLHPRPQTLWYETSCLLILSIYAPDIDDYYLRVTKSCLHFSAIVGGIEQALVLNFLGTVEPQYVSHEIRGLNVVVRLVKSVFMKWPRLLKQKEKMPWINYNLNMINTKEMEELLPQQFLGRALHATNKNRNRNADSEDSEENENYLYETFTPIYNNEDLHDPMDGEMF